MDFLRCSALAASFYPGVECGSAFTPIRDANRIAAKMINHAGSSAGQRLPATRSSLERTS